MKRIWLACVGVLALTGCSASDSASDQLPSGPLVSVHTLGPVPARPTAMPLSFRVVATMPLESGDLMRVALCGGHYAYVAGQSQIMLADWRALTTRAVFSTDHSFLYAVRQVGCRFEVFDTVNGYNGEDPSEPGRTLELNLRTTLYAVTDSSSAPDYPSRVVHGSTFTARLRAGHVWATPLTGGQEVRLPGKVGRTGGLPVAHGTLLAYPVWHHGRTRLQVLRIGV